MYLENPLPILMFHDISDRRGVISLSPTVFRSGLARLHEAGYKTVALEDVAECLHSVGGTGPHQAGTKSQPLPEPALAITFDDGFETVYSQAFPILQQYGLSATIFLTVGDRPNTTSQARLPVQQGRAMLSWGEIREMHRHGISFGAHTLTHPDLRHIPPDRVETEICTSKEVIEDALGVAVPTFAYPYGYYDQGTRDIVAQHFVCACSVRLGLVSAASDPYALERVDSHYLRTERLFGLIVSPWFPWFVRARSIPRRIRRILHWRMG